MFDLSVPPGIFCQIALNVMKCQKEHLKAGGMIHHVVRGVIERLCCQRGRTMSWSHCHCGATLFVVRVQTAGDCPSDLSFQQLEIAPHQRKASVTIGGKIEQDLPVDVAFHTYWYRRMSQMVKGHLFAGDAAHPLVSADA